MATPETSPVTELRLSLHGVMDRLLLLMGEQTTVSLGYLPSEQGTLTLVNVGDPNGRDFVLSALGIKHLVLLRVLLADLESSELGENIEERNPV